MRNYPLILDGVTYNVRLTYETITRSAELISGQNAGMMLSGREELDLIGTGYTYEMTVEADPMNVADYDAFYDAVTAPVETHEITLPYGQSTITFDAQVLTAYDVFAGRLAGQNRFKRLTVTFKYSTPQRTPESEEASE